MGVMAKKKTTAEEPKDGNGDDEVGYLLRLPAWMKEALEADAKKNFRPLKQHIQWLIQQRLDSLKEDEDSCSP